MLSPRLRFLTDHSHGFVAGNHSIFSDFTIDEGCSGNDGGHHKFGFSNGKVLCEYCGSPALRR